MYYQVTSFVKNDRLNGVLDKLGLRDFSNDPHTILFNELYRLLGVKDLAY